MSLSQSRSKSSSPGPSFHLVRSPEEYANAVKAHARQTTSDSLYPGHNYENLSQYLLQPYQVRGHRDKSLFKIGDTQDECFATLYDLGAKQPDRIQSFHHVQDFLQVDHLGDPGGSRLLFLRGNPTPEWLNAIGYKCNVDPEFFLRHLDFRVTASKTDYFSLPSLPSSTSNILRLHWTTIGSRATLGREKHGQEEIEFLRQASGAAMTQYLHDICVGHDMKISDSIVRRFAVHDETHFSFEQDVSVCVNTIGQGYIIIVWLDIGNELTEGPHGPWIAAPQRSYSWTTSVLPTIHHKPNIALEGRNPMIRLHSDSIKQPAKLTQSASLLYRNYGKSLDQDIMCHDAFYALDELFSFTAFSEAQFLNMMETKLMKETDFSVINSRHSPTLSNLLYSKRILDQHAQNIRETISSITSRGGSEWESRAGIGPPPKTAVDAATKLLKDFEYLLDRAKMLSAYCDRGMSIVMNNNMLVESQRAIEQATGVARLTRLAFFYIPLSFTCSFFGMNFVQFGQGELSIWLWFVASIPVFLISVMFLAWDMSKPFIALFQGAKKMIRRLTPQ